MRTKNRLAALAGALAMTLSAGAKEPMNVLFLSIDDLRPELGCYGDSIVKSPHIDKLASEGMRFDRAYCSVPVCGASRASLMTGILPTKDRYVNHLAKVDEDTPKAVTMPPVFREAGYTTLAYGKILHTSSDAAERSWSQRPVGSGMDHTTALDPATKKKVSDRGYGLFYECVEAPDNAYGDGVVAERAIEALRKLKEDGKPFFLACGFIRPHLPFYAPKKYWDLYDEDEISLADNSFRPRKAPKALRGSKEYQFYERGDFELGSEAYHRKMRHGYFASTSYADKLTGDVLKELEALGLADNTIVVIWGDHGFHLGEHTFWGKHNTMHNALRIPLIVKVPGMPAGVATDSLISSVDIYPTLCALAGLEVPESVQGTSFETVLADPEKEINESIYTRFKNADNVVTERFSYSLYENGEEMLFDREKDPKENRNVVGDSDYEETLEELRAELARHMAMAKAAKF